MALHLMRTAVALLVVACLASVTASVSPQGGKKLLAAQSFGSVATPTQPKAVARGEWGPKFPSTGNKRLLAAQSFGSVATPTQPKAVARGEWGPKFPSTGNTRLLAAQSFGSVATPTQPKAVARGEWGPKFPSTGNKKLLAFVAPEQPRRPAEVKPSRFAPRQASSSSSNSAAQGRR